MLFIRNSKFNEILENKINLIEKYFDVDIYSYVYKNYDNYIYKLLLNNEINKKLYLKLKNNTSKNNRDIRTVKQFARNIIINWIVEDLLLMKLNKNNVYEFKLNGTDKNRKFNKNVSTKSDFSFYKNDVKIGNVELVTQYSNFFKNNRYIDLRYNKLSNMLNNNKNEFIMILDLFDKSCHVVNINNNINYNKTYNYYWNKQVERLYYFK